MKTRLLIILIAAAGLSALADDLSLKDGTVLRNATVISADPERLLVVHDGGGCQVKHADLAADSLTPALKRTIEDSLRAHVERARRLEQARTERRVFEDNQRAKGFIEFEGEWMPPSEREKILQARKTAVLEREKLRVEIAKRQAELEEEELQTARARQLLEGDRNQSSITIYSGTSRHYPSRHYPSWRRDYGCSYYPSAVNPYRSSFRSSSTKSRFSHGSLGNGRGR